jgi:hypothetical protein
MPNPSTSTAPATITKGPSQGDQRTFVHSASPGDINGALQDMWTLVHQQQQNHRELTAAVAAIPPPPTPAATAAALSQSGSNPLNVSGLSGQLPQVQYAAIPVLTAAPTLANFPGAQQDQVVIYNGHLYHFSATPFPGAWTLVL